MTYLVTGATGGFGTAALNALKELVPQSEIFALARNKEKAASLEAAGFNVRIGNYADIDSMKAALEGIDRLLFVSGEPGNRQEEHKNVVDAAKEAGVSYIVYTSFPKAEESTMGLAPDHVYTEQVIKESGIPHTFTRNNWYFENELGTVDAAIKHGVFLYQGATGKAGWVLRRELAEGAAKVLVTADSPEVLEFSGKPITYAELAQAVKEATGADFKVVAATADEFVASLTESGLPQEVAEIVLGIQQGIEENQLNVDSDDLEKALGKPLTKPVDALKELLK